VAVSFDERVDVVDLILKVLKDHEKSLDTLVSQLGETLSQPQAAGTIQVQGYNKYKVVLRRWFEFRDRCLKSDLIAFDMVGDKFHVSSVKNGSFYTYSETIPEVTIKMEKDGDKVLIEGGEFMSHEDPSYVFNGKLQCGLGVNTRKAKVDLPNGDTVHKIMYDVDPEEARVWLSDELKTEKKSIVYGVIEL
jgi:hypothetical protein